MSPILEISLAVICFFWIAPAVWVISNLIRSLPRKFQAAYLFVRSAPALIQYSVWYSRIRFRRFLKGRQDSLKIFSADAEYQNLQSELVALRQAAKAASTTVKFLQYERDVLTKSIQNIEGKVQGSTTTQDDVEQLTLGREKLVQLEEDLRFKQETEQALLDELSKKEQEVSFAYSAKQVFIATTKAASANNHANMMLLLSSGAATKTIEKMELKVRQRERQAYGSNHLSDQNINFPVFSESVSRLPLDKLSRGELEELLSTIEHALGDLWAVVERMEVNDELLFSQLKAAEADAQSWRQQAEEAEREEKEFFAKQAKVYQFDCEVSARKYRQMLDSSTKETSELKVMEMKLARKKEEIYLRIAELDSESNDRKSVK